MVKQIASPDLGGLLSEMTLSEKLGQLTMLTANMALTGPGLTPDYLAAVREGTVGSMLNLYGVERTREAQKLAVEETRLGIPLFFGFDVIHGHRTVFPIPLGEAAAFDPDLWERTARAAAQEAAADGLDLTFTPMLDVCRDPRWGRIAESPGEDAEVTLRFGLAKVRGFEGSGIAATAKHLGAYGAVAGGREYAPVDVSERQMQEVYLPPFKAVVDAGVCAVMPSFNDLGGVPMSAHVGILRDLVRRRWGFDGVMISDYTAIPELVNHGIAADLAEAAALALRAGMDVDMMGFTYLRGLPEALERGLVTMAEIDESVLRVLRLKEHLGLFADPYVRMREGSSAADLLPKHRPLAREAAARSMVLLTNAKGLLPLADPPGRVAVLGPLADDPAAMRGTWWGAGLPEETVSYLEGLRAAWPACAITTAAGVSAGGLETDGIAEAVALARAADLVILCLGEETTMSGEGASRARPGLPGRQAELARAVLAVGRPVLLVLTAGRPLIEPWIFAAVDAALMAWGPGTEAGHALADVLTGKVNPSGRLPVSWPYDAGQIPVFHSQRPTGRPPEEGNRFSSRYIDMPVEPQFRFGHGLSYGRFVVEGLSVDRPTLRPGESVTAEVTVRCEGPVGGRETVLLFARDPVASVARPLLELKDWAQVDLQPGETRRVTFTLEAERFRFLDARLSPVLEPGRIELLAGPQADREQLASATIELELA